MNYEQNNGALVKLYTIGFALSVLLTLAAYFVTTFSFASGWPLLIGLSVLALTQFMVQLIYFLHIGQEPKPRLNLMSLLFALMVVITIVFGSLWIMNNLHYGHKHSAPVNESDQKIIKDEGY